VPKLDPLGFAGCARCPAGWGPRVAKAPIYVLVDGLRRTDRPRDQAGIMCCSTSSHDCFGWFGSGVSIFDLKGSCLLLTVHGYQRSMSGRLKIGARIAAR
jgi:hypothetical protein